MVTSSTDRPNHTVDCGWCHKECDPRRAYDVAGEFFCSDDCKRAARGAAVFEAAKLPADPH